MRRSLLALAVSAVSLGAQQPTPPVSLARDTVLSLDRIVAVVGDQPITQYDVQERMLQLQQQPGFQPPTNQQEFDKMAADVIGQLIDEELLVQKAGYLKVEVADADLNAAVERQIREVRGRFASDAEFRGELQKAGLGTPEEYRRFLIDQMRRNELQRRVIEKLRQEGKIPPVNVTQAEVEEAFERSRATLPRRPATVTFRQIVVAPKPSDAARAVAKAKAESLLAEISGGAEFERVARRESADSVSREQGGDLGWNRRGRMVKEFEQWMFALRPGALSPVIETVHGFHIIRVDRVQPGEVKSRHILVKPVIDSADIERARTGLGKPFLNLNQAGGSLGGPIVKNKLLFYANYEAYRRRAEALVNTAILTPDAVKGIFTYRDDQNRVQKVNVLRAVGLNPDPAADEVLAQIPGPDQINNFEVGDSDRELLRNTAGYRYLAQDNGDRDAITTRTDFVPNERSIIGVTYQYTRDEPDRPDIGNGYHRVPVLKEFSHTQLLSMGWRWSPNPRWSNELRGGFNLAPGEFRTTEDRGNPLISGFFFTNPVVNFDPEGRYTDTFNLMDNASYQRGNHSLKFGVWGQKVLAESFSNAGTIPSFGIGIGLDSPYGLSTRFFPGGISGADFDAATALLATRAGLIGAGSQTFNIRDRNSGFVPGEEWRRNFRLNALAFYGQDTWRVNPRLTVNLGLRWEYMGRFDERDGLLLSPVQNAGTMIDTLLGNAEIDFAGGAAGRALYTRDLNNFAPNLGIAYDLFGDGRTAIRAGYSINYVIDEVMRAGDNATASNDGLQGFVARRNLNLRLSERLPEFDAPEYGIPRRASDNFAIDPTSALFAIDPELRAPYVQQWNFGIQHEVARGTVVEARYVGNKGTKLLRGFDFNQVIIRENGFLDDFVRARSNAFLSLEQNGNFDPRFNAAIPGSQPLTFFPQLRDGGALGDPTVGGLIRSGEPADLATLYILNDFATGPGTTFRLNPDSFVADLITNYSNSSYHAFQSEIRRRVAAGLLFQANYSFSKVLTDSSGSGTRFDAFLDIHQPQLERARADFDVTHVFNANFVWPLPFGAGHRWSGGKYERLLGGWNVSSIIGWQSGAPLSILSGRASLNRSARSGENTATTSLTMEALDDIVGFRMTDDGPYFIAASAISSRDNSGVAPDGEPAFAGQVFFHPEPGELGTLQRRLFSGPSAFAFDLAVGKDTRIRESQQVTFGVKIQNVLNHPAFYSGSQVIGSTQFGRIGGVLVGSRVMEFHLRYSF